MTHQLHRGRIIGLYRKRGGSGIALLGIEDDRRGKVLIPCDGNRTCRAFDAAFPGTLRGGRFNNEGIEGEVIYYTVSDIGVLESFSPADSAPPELIEKYEKAATKKPATQKAGHIGIVEGNAPAYGGRGTHTRGGFLPEDHPLFSRGPIVAGRPILHTPKKKPSENN